MSKKRISKSDFTFISSGYGHYKVMYQSPITGIVWAKIIDDMTLIDCTKNEEYPTQENLQRLKRTIKDRSLSIQR